MLEKVLLSFCLLFTTVVNGFFVTLDAHAEECFFDKVTAGTKLGILSSLLLIEVVLNSYGCVWF